MEQVPGFQDHRNRKNSIKIFQEVLNHFRRRGYSITWQVLDGANYGLPASRRRFILMAAATSGPKELMQCIMTDGGRSKYFHDGSRRMTDRELAACQSFPNNYEFFGNTTSVRTQIGNAVAPIFAEAIYGRVRKSLEDFDALNAKYNSIFKEDNNDVEMGNDRILGLMKNLNLATSELDDDSKKIDVKVRI
ncbi:hypothetical protein HYFRA_00010230 [Hymenoscyphus fraxineus]|uniref:DNA (cytosine-5-)-methyltransferase n=1 Tax=Hymenoscyphus fraxineus TaxID=746836 RepID=A0A9N9PRU6_9HELO|nr:hypothetical protein HYFRA_00010230 [Hymenoscyphus fraxineus]